MAAEEAAIMQEVAQRPKQPRGISEFIGLLFVLAYAFYLIDIASLLLRGQLMW